MSRAHGNWMFQSAPSMDQEPGARSSSARFLSTDSLDALTSSPRSDSKRMQIGSPLQFLRNSVRSWSKSSCDDSADDSPSTDLASLAPGDADEMWAGDFPGISVSHLLSIARDPSMTVGEALETLNYQADDAYVNSLDTGDVGQAHAVVLHCNSMRWQEFVAALALAGGPSRRVWIRELCTLSSSVDWKQVIAAVGNVDLVLPSWTTPGLFWTPENLAVTRIPDAKCRILMAETDKLMLRKALLLGLSQSYFDDLLAPEGNMGAKTANAIKSFIVGLVIDSQSAKDRDGAFSALMGQLALAHKNYDGAVLYLKAQSDLTLLAEAYRRNGNLSSARACLKLAIEGDTDTESRAQCALQRARVLLQMKNFDRALETAKAAFKVFQRYQSADGVAECWSLIADIFTATDDAQTAYGFLKDAAEALVGSTGDSVDTANAMHKLGLHQHRHVEGGNELAVDALGKALLIFQASFGDVHAKTLACKRDKALVLMALDRVCEAADLLRDVHEQHQLMYGPEDLRAVATLDCLVDALIKSGSGREAARRLEEYCECLMATHGPTSDVVTLTLKRTAGLLDDV